MSSPVPAAGPFDFPAAGGYTVRRKRRGGAGMDAAAREYYVYLLRCGDGSLYAGITTDPARRFAEHAGRSGRGAKYTAAHRPIRFEALWRAEGRAAASRLEAR